MPIFEYKCNDCDSKYDFLHKSVSNIEEVNCPSCGSANNKKLLSTFSSSIGSSPDFGSCTSGSCGVPAMPANGCASGMCGLN